MYDPDALYEQLQDQEQAREQYEEMSALTDRLYDDEDEDTGTEESDPDLHDDRLAHDVCLDNLDFASESWQLED